MCWNLNENIYIILLLLYTIYIVNFIIIKSYVTQSAHNSVSIIVYADIFNPYIFKDIRFHVNF